MEYRVVPYQAVSARPHLNPARFAGVQVLGVDEHVWHHQDRRRRGPRDHRHRGPDSREGSSHGKVEWTWCRAGLAPCTRTGWPSAEKTSVRGCESRRWIPFQGAARTPSLGLLQGRHQRARRRATVPRACPCAPQALQKGSSNPIGMRHSITACLAVRYWPTAVSPRASRPRKVVRSGPVKVVSGTSRSLVTVV